MSNWKSIMRWAAPVLIVVGLGGTHWLAYWLGTRNEHQRIAAAVTQIYDNSQAEAFDLHLQYLRLLSKHPNDLLPGERVSFCQQTKSFADFVEQARVVHNRRLGNDPAADRWQQKIDEARRLIAKLNPEKQ
jgi:hypothetical protein